MSTCDPLGTGVVLLTMIIISTTCIGTRSRVKRLEVVGFIACVAQVDVGQLRFRTGLTRKIFTSFENENNNVKHSNLAKDLRANVARYVLMRILEMYV